MTPPGVLAALGIGCRSGCPAAAIHALLEQALCECGLGRDVLHRVASVDSKADESGLARFANDMMLPLSLWPTETLKAFAPRLHTASARVRATTGVDGIAEAAALATVSDGDPDHPRARLILPRRANERATIALAGIVHDGLE